MIIGEKIIATGEVDIKVFKDGQLIDRIQENNLVVTLGKTNIAKLLGGDAAGKKISKIAVGTNGDQPNVANNAITNIFSKALSNVTYPDANSALFHFDITDAEANGLTIREFGLLNDDNVLCARKVRDAAIEKTASVRLVGTWKISIN